MQDLVSATLILFFDTLVLGSFWGTPEFTKRMKQLKYLKLQIADIENGSSGSKILSNVHKIPSFVAR